MEKFFHGGGEEFSLLDFAAKLREGSIFEDGFCVLHLVTSARITEPGDTPSLAKGTTRVNKNIAFCILLKYMYFF
jgi:hypothetical protein